MKLVNICQLKGLLLLLLLINSNNLLAQSYSKTRAFTIEDGLPSNHIYDTTEDAKGFLWVATDNGISRFDGKYFKNYTIRNGLPSNDVLQVLVDKEGTIWVNCYKKPPAYYDRDKNEFITLNNAITKKYSSNYYMYYVSPKGEVCFAHDINIFSLHNKNIVRQQIKFNTFYLNNETLCDSINYNHKTKKIRSELYITNESNQKKLIVKRKYDDVEKTIERQSLLFVTKKVFYKITNVNSNKLTCQLDSINTTKEIKWYKISGEKLCLNFADNSVGVYNKNTLKEIETIDNKINLNIAYIDNNNNAWLCTLNNGLLLYQKNWIQNTSYAEQTLNKNFLSCACSPNGILYAGNDAGEIIATQNNKSTKQKIISNSPIIWSRKIICTNSRTAVIHDAGISINFKPSSIILTKDHQRFSLKTAVKVNDSILLLGTIKGLLKYNLNTSKYYYQNCPEIRVTDIVKASDIIFYFIANDGLYQYNYEKDLSTKIPLEKNTLEDSPTFLTYDQNHSLWVTTLTGNIFALKNNKIIKKISNTIGLPENITCLLSVQNKLWIGSKSGIYIVDPATNTFDKLTTIDGLSTNFINALTIQNNMIIAATTEGIIKIPTDIILPKFDITPQVTSLKINNKNSKISNNYDLDSYQNNIYIELAGTELTGHFQKFQYAINNTKEWNSLSENNLNIQLNAGISTIYIRAINTNNQIGKKTIAIKFNISNPFYKTIWFWLLIFGYLMLISIWLVYRRRLRKQRIAFKQQLALEQQRNKITADLHDDIGATLSSLQLNSAIAHQLIKKDVPRTEELLDKIENQSKDLADKIGDIIWSMKPGKDEFMTMSSRIKNFANDILGATNIDYDIIINPEIDSLLTDITTRKNIVLIAKEAINNVAKYSIAKNVHITFQKENNVLLLCIIDDGIGFNPEIVKGNGITNLKKRAYEINSILTIISSEKKGTSITLQIPCP